MSSAKNKIVLKKLKELNTIWHPESTLVFKSSTEKIVIGRYENEKLVIILNASDRAVPVNIQLPDSFGEKLADIFDNSEYKIINGKVTIDEASQKACKRN